VREGVRGGVGSLTFCISWGWVRSSCQSGSWFSPERKMAEHLTDAARPAGRAVSCECGDFAGESKSW
jgi:hypothetical protein